MTSRGGRGWRRREREVREEFEAHLAHRVDELVDAGVDPAEARRRAREEFGDVERLEHETVEAGRTAERATGRRDGTAGPLDALGRDLRFALRQLARDPLFAFLAVATIGLGIAATSTVVGVVRAVVLEPLPFAQPDRLVYVEEVTPAGHTFTVSEPAYLDWREQADVFEEVSASTVRSGILGGGDEPSPVRVLWASASLLPTLGVEPALGRGFTEEEDAPAGRAAVTLLSDRLWRTRFAADPGVVGTDLVLNGRAHRVVGVLPPELPLVGDEGLVVPLGADPSTDRDEHYLDVVARLAPAVGLDEARRGMRRLAERLGETWPEDRGWSVKLSGLRELLVGPDLTRAGWVLLGGASLLLLMACVNVSNLLLARATVRRGEMGVRMALGAGRGRLVRQLFTESLVLAGLGAALGWALARVALPAVRRLGAGQIPRLEQATLGPDVLVTCLLAAAGAAVIFGLAPALALGRDATAGPLRAMGRGGSRRRGPRRTLVAAQVALSVMLLVGTGLLARSFVRLASVDPGFDPEGTLSVQVTMPPETYDPDARRALMDAILREVRAVPGVRAAGATVVAPFSGSNLMNNVARSDRVPVEGEEFPATAWRIVTPGFTDALGVELLAGREFRAGDGWEGDQTPVLVNAALVRRLWAEEGGGARPAEALGATLVWGDPAGSRLRVVGVVGDVRDWRLDEEPMPVIYRPYEQIPWTGMTVVARTAGPSAGLREPFREAVRRAAPALALPRVRSLGEHVGEAVAAPRFHTLLLALFAACGLALAAIGVYGVTAFDVARRVREIGIRIAVGGSPDGIRGMVLADSLRPVALGAAVGGGAAWLAARWVESILFRTTATDPVTWVVVVGVLGAVAGAAAWIPARRATRVSPTEALAAE